jgi:[ribosomal protein S18]-alanine N-acetyltransferase
MSGLRVRAMQAAEIDAVLALAASLPGAPHWARAAYQTVLSADSTPARVALVAATAQGAVAGFAIASLLPPEAELETIAVAPEQQRRGVGRELLKSLAETLRPRGVRSLLLEVRASNEAALRLYQQAGFLTAGRRPGYYSDPSEDALLMRLTLG